MRPGVWDAMEPFSSVAFGNASGLHAVSRRAKNALEEAREQASELLGCRPQEIVFTSGGTEADNLAVKGAALARRGRSVAVTAIEHEAVLESAAFLRSMGTDITTLAVSGDGIVDLSEVGSGVEGAAVLSVMVANNETGVVQPVAEAAGIARRLQPDIVVHTDAVQAFSSHSLNVEELDVDLLSLAAHKFGGPKGVGLLYVRSGVQLEPVLHGGGQELGRRSGTHNVMSAVGMVAAMDAAAADRVEFSARTGRERAVLERELLEAGAEITGAGVERLPQHCHFRLPGHLSETVLIRLDAIGVAASAGSACQSGAVTPSHVTTAMGWDSQAAGESIRLTFGWDTQAGDGATAAAAVIEAARS